MTAVSMADLILLVTEPTPFGIHDLKLAHQAFSEYEKPMALVINRGGLEDRDFENYCRENDLPVLLQIPFDRRVAQAYSEGKIIVDALDDLRPGFGRLRDDLRNLAEKSSGGSA